MRTLCELCKRPLKACFCKNIVKQFPATKVTILVHPDEINHPLGTALMASLSLDDSLLLVGTNFTGNKELANRLETLSSAVVYPKENATLVSELSSTEIPKHIILLDGTWRKAKRILQETPELNQLPFLTFSVDKDPLYEIRKPPNKKMFSTLEAVIHILNAIEFKDYSESLAVLTKQIDLHKNYMGEKFNKFYKKG